MGKLSPRHRIMKAPTHECRDGGKHTDNPELAGTAANFPGDAGGSAGSSTVNARQQAACGVPPFRHGAATTPGCGSSTGICSCRLRPRKRVGWNIACLSNRCKIRPNGRHRLLCQPRWCRQLSLFQHRWSRPQEDNVDMQSEFRRHRRHHFDISSTFRRH